MIDPTHLALIASVLLLAGLVKGVVGLGLPTVTLALLTPTIGLAEAMTAMLLPSFLTNVQQMVAGGEVRAMLRRLWPFLAAVAVGTLLTGNAVAVVATGTLIVVLGASIALYAALGLLTPPWPQPGRHEGWLGPVSGFATGALTGMTGSFVIPSVPYLQALGLGRDRLVQAMGATFTVATVALGAALGGYGLIPQGMLLGSAVGVLPAVIGVEIGRRVRHRLPELVFRRLLFAALLVMGLWMIWRQIAGWVSGQI